VFKLKHTTDGTVERFKARLLAKRYARKYGIDYDKNFLPVVRVSAIRRFLAFAVENDLLIHQIDVETALKKFTSSNRKDMCILGKNILCAS